MLALALALTLVPAPAAFPAAAESLLVTPEWVNQRMKQPGLVIFEIGDKAKYDAGHIPGAQFLGMRDVSAPRQEGRLALELPDAARIDSVLEARGVSDDSYVVLYYGEDWISPTTRIFLTLEYAGLRGRVSIMDGGLAAWRARGFPVTAEVPAVSPGRFTPRLRNDITVNADFLAQHLADPDLSIIDARNRGFYIDSVDAQMPRGGHIPTAKNLPYVDVARDDNTIRPLDELRALFAAAGVEPGKLVVSYCHIGQQGTLVYFAARLLGYKVRLYDGSFEEWSARGDLPVEGDLPSAASHGH